MAVSQAQEANGSERGGSLRDAPVVVGVDGSKSARNALRWAGHYARAVGLPLLAVTTWMIPQTYGWAPPLPEDEDLRAEAQTMLESELKEALGDTTGLKVTTEVVPGHPAAVLNELSNTASLVVVGSRGHGELVGLLVGSIGINLTTHAHCPVVIVHPDDLVDDVTSAGS